MLVTLLLSCANTTAYGRGTAHTHSSPVGYNTAPLDGGTSQRWLPACSQQRWTFVGTITAAVMVAEHAQSQTELQDEAVWTRPEPGTTTDTV